MHSPAVSICVVTYNHQRYLAQALDSVLMQQTAFPIEIVVGVDRSTDDTRQIARRFAAAHPNLITLIEREQNVGGNRNFALTLSRCRGKYVALLDGDDYWTSPHKLQRQFDFLQSHPRCTACFHAAHVVHDDAPGRNWVCRPTGARETYGLRDLFRRYQFQTASAMIRTDAVPALPSWYFRMNIGDRTLFAMLAERGSLGYIDQIMSAYRIHRGGLWSGQDRIWQLLEKLKADEALRRHFRHEHDCLIQPRIAESCVELACRYEKRGDLLLARRFAIRAISTNAWRSRGHLKSLVRILAWSSSPHIYARARSIYRSLRQGGFTRGTHRDKTVSCAAAEARPIHATENYGMSATLCAPSPLAIASTGTSAPQPG